MYGHPLLPMHFPFSVPPLGSIACVLSTSACMGLLTCVHVCVYVCRHTESVEPSFPFPFPLPLPPLPFPGSTQRTPFPLPDPAFGLALLDASPVGQVLARSLGTQVRRDTHAHT